MRYYFAGRYSRHAELAKYRDQLELIPGAKVTSRWIDCHDGELEASYTPEALAADPAGCWRHGAADLEDLNEADVIVSFTDASGGGKGGRHVEHGWAISAHDSLILADDPAFSMRLVVVGPRENIFHCHPGTEVYADFAEFLTHEAPTRFPGDPADEPETDHNTDPYAIGSRNPMQDSPGFLGDRA